MSYNYIMLTESTIENAWNLKINLAFRYNKIRNYSRRMNSFRCWKET